MYYLGIDLGGTNIVAGVVNEDGQIIIKENRKTTRPCTMDALCNDMAEAATAAIVNAGLSKDDLQYIGIGAPGAVNSETGVIEYANNFNFHNWEIVRMMEERLGIKVYVENDANSAAYGEYCVGAAKDANDAVMITLGTGVGGGIIVDGMIYSGSNYAGAEVGHTVIQKGGRLCTCGRRGCWEAYSSATGLINMTKEACQIQQAPNYLLYQMIGGDLNKIEGKTAFDAAQQGCPLAKSVIDMYLDYLGCGLVNIINLFQPEILCIGGGISRQGDYLLPPVMKIIERERYTKHNNKQTKVCIAELGNDAGLIGAAFLGK